MPPALLCARSPSDTRHLQESASQHAALVRRGAAPITQGLGRVSNVQPVELSITTEDPRIAELCRLYWAAGSDGQYLHTVKELTERFGLRSGQANQLVRDNSEAFSVHHRCPRCGKGLIVHSRTDLAQFQRYPASDCRQCKTELMAVQERQTKEREATRRAAIIATFPVVDSNPISVQDLDIRSAITLGALIRDGEFQEGGIITPLIARSQRLAPRPTLALTLTRSLFNRGLILIHPASPVDAFEWDRDTPPNAFYIDRVAYYLSGAAQTSERITRLDADLDSILPYDSWPASWTDQFTDFWREIAVAECESYLVFCLAQHGLDFNPGTQTVATIEKGLAWFTIGQLFNLIWRAVRDASAYWAREKVPKKQAANSAVTRLRSQIERAYAEGWSLAPYKRDSRLPVSGISHLLLTTSLTLGDPLNFNPLTDEARSPTKLQWDKLSADEFERLIFSLVSDAEGYTDVDWLMKTHAPDHGRDVGATCLRIDSLSGYHQERVVVQCKHWLSRSIRDNEIAKEVISVEHWSNPPVDVLAIATSGRFTADAVSWVERHNAKGVRPRVEMWNDAKLESPLADRPHLILSFGLR